MGRSYTYVGTGAGAYIKKQTATTAAMNMVTHHVWHKKNMTTHTHTHPITYIPGIFLLFKH